MPTAEIRDIECGYVLDGAGPRVLFLNGSGATLEQVAPLLDFFRGRFEVLAADHRGIGRSAAPDRVPTMADFALDALALTDHVGWTRFRVCGISFGGMVAQELAVTAPERIERLALLCTSSGGDGGSSYPLHELSPEGRTPTLLDTRFTDDWLSEHPGDQGLAAAFGSRGDSPPIGVTRQLEARSHHDVWSRLDRIDCPTFVAAGRWDGIAPLSNSEALASRIPHADLRVYDGGHLFFVQDERAMPDLVEFLAG